jgi:hypothetical protein
MKSFTGGHFFMIVFRTTSGGYADLLTAVAVWIRTGRTCYSHCLQHTQWSCRETYSRGRQCSCCTHCCDSKKYIFRGKVANWLWLCIQRSIIDISKRLSACFLIRCCVGWCFLWPEPRFLVFGARFLKEFHEPSMWAIEGMRRTLMGQILWKSVSSLGLTYCYFSGKMFMEWLSLGTAVFFSVTYMTTKVRFLWRKFLSSPSRQDRLSDPPVVLSEWYCGTLALEVKRLKPEAGPSLPSRAGAENVWSYTSVSPYLLRMCWFSEHADTVHVWLRLHINTLALKPFLQCIIFDPWPTGDPTLIKKFRTLAMWNMWPSGGVYKMYAFFLSQLWW